MDQDPILKKGPDQEPTPETGPATDHPGEKAAEAHKEYDIDIFRDWCKSCGICAAFCPQQCLSRDADGAPLVAAAERCTGCRWCELHCPDFAICIRELKAPTLEEEAV